MGLLLLFAGCNSNGSKSDIEKKENVLTNKNIGYLQLKDNVAASEAELKMVKVNLYLADKLMPQIQAACVDIPLAQTCEIADGELSFVLDSEMKNDIMEIAGVTMPDDTPDETLTLGKTTFAIYDDAEDYQYVLVMDMTAMSRRSATDNATYLQTLKWSKDENHIWSIYSEKGEDNSTLFSLRYSAATDGQTQMEFDALFHDLLKMTTVKKIDESFHLKLMKREDYFKIISNRDYLENEKQIYRDFSLGEVSNKGGYLNFKGVYLDSEYRETNKFDDNEKTVFSAYCIASQTCNLNDESTWVDQGDSTFEPDLEAQMRELFVTGGALKKGKYFLLAPNSDISKLSEEEIFDAAIGDIYVDDEVTFGTLYQKEYLSSLESLVMVRIVSNMDETPEEPNQEVQFELVKAEERPLLSEK